MSGVEGGENWSKLCSWGGQVSTPSSNTGRRDAVPFGWSKLRTQYSVVKGDFL